MDAWKKRQAVQLGQNIRERRKQLGISQTSLAEGICSTQTVSLIERGKLNVSPETLATFAERLQCDVDDLLRLNDLQDDWLDELSQTALQHDEKHQYSEALEAFHTLYTESLAKGSTKYLRTSTYHLCLLYNKTGKYTVSNEWGREALRLLDPAQHLDLTLTTYNTLGRNYIQSGKMWEAFDLFREGEKLIDQYEFPIEQAGVIFYNIAGMKQLFRNWAGCIWYCERALKIFEENDSIIKVGGLHMMIGTSYSNQGRFEKARHHYERSIRILSQTADQLSLARAYQNLGVLEKEMGQIESARKNFLRSLKLKRQVKDFNTIPSTLRTLAQLSVKEKKLEEARHYLQEAKKVAEQLKQSLQLAQTLKQMGDLALESGDEEQFISLYKQAIDYLDKLKFSSDLAEASEKLGEFYVGKGMENLAIPYLLKATEHYRKLLKQS